MFHLNMGLLFGLTAGDVLRNKHVKLRTLVVHAVVNVPLNAGAPCRLPVMSVKVW